MRSDVCLILEGTYPYTAGGVSTWVGQILEHMAHLRFSMVYIGPSRDLPRTAKYRIPPNVVEIREAFLYDTPNPRAGGAPRSVLTSDEWEVIGRFQRDLAAGLPCDVRAASQCMERVTTAETMVHTLAGSPESWDMLVRHYEAAAPPNTSFLDYFWTHRFINIPALNLLRTPMPRARIYHAACTGYAGLLGAKAHYATGVPLILTEHGIYARERRIEIFNAAWIQDTAAEAFLDMRRSQSYFKQWWTQFFLALSRTAYGAAEHIITLFEANRQAQLRDGAPPECTRIIPNAIDTAAYASIAPRRREPADPLQIGFVGRITAIKDVKTLLRALAILRKRGVRFDAHLMGPLDQEEDYAAECQELAGSLGLGDLVHFMGSVQVEQHYGQLDVVVLTSLSEGLPFAILEANCAALPVVASDVGACRELLEGRTAEDKALGESGIITPVASPPATASALERIARSPELGRRLGEAGRRRVQKHYDIRDVMNSYLELYETHLYAAGRAGGH